MQIWQIELASSNKYWKSWNSYSLCVKIIFFKKIGPYVSHFESYRKSDSTSINSSKQYSFSLLVGENEQIYNSKFSDTYGDT